MEIFQKGNINRILSASLIAAFALSAFLVDPAFADCTDGDSSGNTLSCSSSDSNNWTGAGGDDTMTLEDTGYVERAVSGGTGDDTIVINGEVNENLAFGDSVYGDGVIGGGGGTGGNDSITINGYVDGDVLGDGMLNVIGSTGGDDEITVGVDAGVGGNVTGDGILSLGNNSGGDDLIVINGWVGGSVLGDGTLSTYGDSSGGDDVIVINGTAEIEGDVYADAAFGDDDSFGGDDEVVVNAGATIWGSMYGGLGIDSLALTFIPQSTLNGLDPNGDSIDWGAKHYEWYEFESLIGQILAQLDDTRSVIFLSGNLLGLDEETGIKIFSNDGPVAFVPYADLAGMLTGDSLTYQAPNSGGWYVIVTDLGVNPDNGGNHLYQISIYDGGGSLQGQFTVAN